VAKASFLEKKSKNYPKETGRFEHYYAQFLQSRLSDRNTSAI